MARLRDERGLQQSASLQQSADEHAEVRVSGAWDTQLHLPPWVPAGEARQVEQLLDGWVAELLRVRPELGAFSFRDKASMSRHGLTMYR